MSVLGRSVDARSDTELLEANTPASVSELTTRYCRRAHRVARAILETDVAATRAVDDAGRVLWDGPAEWRRPAGGIGSRLLGLVAREATAARPVGPGRGASGPLAGLSDRQCEVVALAFYGRLPLRSIAHELQVPVGTVTAEINAGMGCLSGALATDALRSA